MDGLADTADSTFGSSSSGSLPYEKASFIESVTWSQTISNLETGTPYYLRVSAQGPGVGFGEPVEARNNPMTPRGVPGQLESVYIWRANGVTLTIEIEQTAETNGAEVESYIIEWSTSPQFGGAQRTTLDPDYCIQAVRLNTWRQGWTTDSKFSLSLFNFRGAFVARLGGEDSNGLPTFVSIVEGTNMLNRTTPNVTAGYGAAPLYKAVSRGGFVSVSGQEFRACLDGNTPYDVDIISLCSVADPYLPESFIGASTKYDNTLAGVPAHVLDTALGSAFRLAVGDTALRTYDGPDTNITVNDLTSILARGDHLRVGHPEKGRVFTVCKGDGTSNLDFNATSVPLCSGEDPEEVVSVAEGDIISATYEIQQFSVWLDSTAEALNKADIPGFRLKFGDETSATSEAGGGPGCLSFFSLASEVRHDGIEVNT